MSLKLTGTVKEILPVQSGESARGSWKKREVIIETNEQYPQMVCLTQWGDSIDKTLNLSVNDKVTVDFSLSSREYNGRWYTDVRAYKVEINSADNTLPPTEIPPINCDDDYPF